MRIQIYDDGSVASKLLQHEQKDTEVIKVSGTDLVENFTKFNNNDNSRVYLPFTVEQLAANNEQLRKDIQKVESLGFRNLLVLPFEGNTEKDIEQRAKDAGVIENEVLKGELSYPNHGGVVQNETNNKKPYKTVRTEDRTVQYLP